MKKFLYLIPVLFLGLASCDNTKIERENDFSKILNPENTNQLTDTCTDTGYQIFKQTAKMWEDSWLTYHSDNDSARQVLQFSKANIASLRASVPNSDGIRLYYCLISSSNIPSLAMVNIVGCENRYGINGDAILISDFSRGQFFADKDTLHTYAELWKDYIDSLNLLIHTPVYAYNYSWTELSNTISNFQTSDLFVALGLRTLSADEYDEFNCSPPRNDQVMGSIVYCNIVYGEEPIASTQEYFNFAKPCPVFCDPTFLNCIR